MQKSKFEKVNRVASDPPGFCVNCKYLDVMQLPPPAIEKITVCRFGPRNLTVIPSQQGMMNLTGYPPIPDPEHDWCWQFKEMEKPSSNGLD